MEIVENSSNASHFHCCYMLLEHLYRFLSDATSIYSSMLVIKRTDSCNRRFSMKTSKLILFFVGFYSLILLDKAASKSMASLAISEVLSSYFAESVWKVDLIFYGSKNGESENLVEEIFRHQTSSTTLTVSRGGVNHPWRNQLKVSSILAFDSLKNFQQVSKDIRWQTRKDLRLKHLVHIPNVTIADLERIQDGFSIDNVDFLVNDDNKSMELVSGFMFSSEKCRSNKFVVINRFERATMRWETPDFYPAKYQNFHGCLLTVARAHRDGIVEEILRSHAQSCNFKLEFERENAKTKNNGIDLLATSQINGWNTVTVTGYAFDIESIKVFVPPGESYSQLEKMLLPFDQETWISILVTVATALLTIQVISFCSIKVRNFVFGQNNTTPTMNLLDIFLNGGQIKVPTRNFARFLLVLFIIWSLIVRTCYQSKTFETLQVEVKKPRIRTIAEIVENDFTLVGDESLRNYILDLGLGDGFNR